MKIKLGLFCGLVFTALFLLNSCNSGNNKDNLSDDFNLRIELPATAEVKSAGVCVFTLTEGDAPLLSDVLILESSKGVSYICPLVEVSPESFTVQVADDCEEGYYNVYIRRDTRKKLFGRIYLSYVDELDFVPEVGTTVYGVVSSEARGVKNVVVSDGVEVTTTDEKGIYQLKSRKNLGCVFISVPSYYEVPSSGILPQFYRILKAKSDVVERVDFSLNEAPEQDSYKMFILGDMHLANRTNDMQQFKQFTSDLNNYQHAHANEKMYAIALGDMTWDLYWYSNNYSLKDYLNTMNSQIQNLQIFHTIGNHDYDFKAVSDFDAGLPFRNYIAPTYYSFNIGKVHYIIMDNIDCSDYDGTTSRKYKKSISAEQLSWLSKDLALVDKTTPVVVAMHAPVFYPSESGDFRFDHDIANTLQLLEVLAGYEVHFVTGHTHLNFNVTPESAITAGQKFYEHNTAAICASWWWSDYLTPGVHISLDGTPGGYGVWNIAGTTIQRIYKATGWPEEYQFRSYDLNKVHFSLADVPLMPEGLNASAKKKYEQYTDAYPVNTNNEVLINIWNWNPSWTLTVTDEAGKKLTPRQVWAYDPLHIAALSVKRFNSADLKSAPNFITEKFPHFFKVTAADADTDLLITVKDEFGHTWTESMQRPKAFSIESYQTK